MTGSNIYIQYDYEITLNWLTFKCVLGFDNIHYKTNSFIPQFSRSRGLHVVLLLQMLDPLSGYVRKSTVSRVEKCCLHVQSRSTERQQPLATECQNTVTHAREMTGLRSLHDLPDVRSDNKGCTTTYRVD